MIILEKISQHNFMKFEADIIKFLQLNMSPSWTMIFQIISLFGGFLGFFLTFLIIFLKKRSLSYAFFIAYLTSQILNKILKIIIARNRPFVDYVEIKNYGMENGYSFPSGHSLSAGLYSTFLIYLILNSNLNKTDKSISIISAVLFALSVMFSRMTLGVHYLSDVIAGLIFGISFAIISILLYNIIMKKLVSEKARNGENNGRNIIGGDKK